MVTVLWIEDEIHNLEALKKMLARRGINIIKARSKSEALEKLSLKFDLILLDVILPQYSVPQSLSAQNKQEPYEDLVGLGILRTLVTKNYSVPIFVFTIVNAIEVRKEIEDYGIPYYYKGSTRLSNLCDDIIKVTGG